MSFLTPFGNGHRRLFFDRSRCSNFRRDSSFREKRTGRNVSPPTERKAGWRKIASARPTAAIFGNVLHPHRQFTKMQLVVTGKCPPKSRE